MNKLIIAILITVTAITVATACLQPLKPLPPLGCSNTDAMLVCNAECECYWTWTNC